MADITAFRPHEASIDPAIQVEVALELRTNRELLVERSAILKLGGQSISRGHVRDASNRGQRRFAYDYVQDRNDQVVIEVDFPLSRRALDYIDDERDADLHGDLGFTVEIHGRLVRLNISAANEIRIGEKDTPSAVGPVYGTDSRYDRMLHLISTNSDGVAFEIDSRTYTLKRKVSSSDWVNTFCEPLGIGAFLSVDIPVIESGISGNGDMEERLRKAQDALTEMNRHMRAGEWNLATQEVRHVAELFRRQEDVIKRLIKQDGIAEEGAEELSAALFRLFDYASKFVHSENRKQKVMDRSKASKEDAQLAYVLAASVVNLISKKLQREGLPGTE